MGERHRRRDPPSGNRRTRDRLRRAMVERQKLRNSILEGDDGHLDNAVKVNREVDRLWRQFCREAGLEGQEGQDDATE